MEAMEAAMSRKTTDYVPAPEIPEKYLALYELAMSASYGAIEVTEAARGAGQDAHPREGGASEGARDGGGALLLGGRDDASSAPPPLDTVDEIGHGRAAETGGARATGDHDLADVEAAITALVRDHAEDED